MLDGDVVGFTDIYSIFAPALADVVLVKDRWLLGDPVGKGRHLTTEEFRQFVDGYWSIRPLSPEECETFGVIWAVCLVGKLTHYTENIERIKDVRIGSWNFHEQILKLPESVKEAESMVQCYQNGNFRSKVKSKKRI